MAEYRTKNSKFINPGDYIQHDQQDLIEAATKAVCKIQTQANKPAVGTGFLCRIDHPVNGELNVLCTCNHVISCYHDFYISFERPGKSIVWKIGLNEIEWIFTDRELDVTFVALNKETIRNFNKKALPFMYLSEIEPSLNSKVIVIQHPKGDILQISEGVVTECNQKHLQNGKRDFDLFHTASTSRGSSGSPIFNENYDIIALHKSRGPKLDTGKYVEYNCGTMIKYVCDKLRKSQPWENEKLEVPKENNLDRLVSLTEENNPALTSCADGLCKISYKIGDDIVYGNGFLCSFSLNGAGQVHGLFTNIHIFNCKPDDFRLIFTKEPHYDIIDKDHIQWFKAYPTMHVSFLAFNKSFGEEICKKQKFLPVSLQMPSTDSKHYILHFPGNEDSPCVSKDLVVKQCNDIHLIHGGNKLPGEAGSVILNEKFEVVAIRNTCGRNDNVGTLVTLDSPVMAKLKSDGIQLFESSSLIVKKRASGLCKVLFRKGWCSAFLCNAVLSPKSVQLKGLIVSNHVIQFKQEFRIYFHMLGEEMTVNVGDVFRCYTDNVLGYSFIRFTDTFMKKLMEKKLSFYSVASKELPVHSRLTIPLSSHGQQEYTSERGILLKYVNEYLHHSCRTEVGSCGAPILNDEDKVVGIHLASAQYDESNSPSYKIGTRIQNILDSIAEKKLNDTV